MRALDGPTPDVQWIDMQLAIDEAALTIELRTELPADGDVVAPDALPLSRLRKFTRQQQVPGALRKFYNDEVTLGLRET